MQYEYWNADAACTWLNEERTVALLQRRLDKIVSTRKPVPFQTKRPEFDRDAVYELVGCAQAEGRQRSRHQ